MFCFVFDIRERGRDRGIKTLMGNIDQLPPARAVLGTEPAILIEYAMTGNWNSVLLVRGSMLNQWATLVRLKRRLFTGIYKCRMENSRKGGVTEALAMLRGAAEAGRMPWLWGSLWEVKPNPWLGLPGHSTQAMDRHPCTTVPRERRVIVWRGEASPLELKPSV